MYINTSMLIWRYAASHAKIKCMAKLKGTHVNIPDDLKKRFKAVCLHKDTSMTDVIVGLIEKWVEENEEPVKKQPQTIAELVQQSLYPLLMNSTITVESLKVIAAGEKFPSDAELTHIAQVLNISEKELFAMRDRHNK